MQSDKDQIPPFVCGLDASLRIMAGKWKPLILFFLCKGTKRYGELKRCIGGVSDKVLIQQLKELESDGIVARHDYREVPPRVDYSVTPLGRSLGEAMGPLCGWGEANAQTILEALTRRL